MTEPVMSSVHSPDSPFFGEVLNQLQRRMRREQFDTWFRGFRLVKLEKEEAEFSVPTVFVRDWISRNYLPAIRESVTEAGRSVRRVRLVLGSDRGTIAPTGAKDAGTVAQRVVDNVGEQKEGAVTASAPAGATPKAKPTRARKVKAIESEHPSQALNRNYTFEQFVVGPSNRVAHAAALAIGENPGCSYNPLFIHGNVGLGKTHLLQAVCHSIRRREPEAKVVYLTSEEFTNEFIAAIQEGTLDNFRSYHREADVLVVDDIQFLASKGKTQEEFFHTFNSLYQHQKQIILSSDRSPSDIPTLEERLVSRFKWGLVTDIETPDFETRVAIVQRKARLRGQADGLPDEVAYLVAERIANNIRELEGAVIKVLGMASILGREITTELAEEALRGVAKARNQHVSLDQIMGVVTNEFSLTARDITGKSRTQAVSLPRQIAMFLSRRHTDHSLEEIGRFFGNRDHTTVLYSVNKIEERVEKDRMLKDLLEGLAGRLQR